MNGGDQRAFRQMLAGEVEDAVDVLERDLLELEQDPTGAIRRGLADAIRAAHSIKGAASIVGAVHLATLCHELEDVLSEVVAGRVAPQQTLVTVLLEALDVMRQAGEHLATGDAPPADDLRAACERIRSTPGRAPREQPTVRSAPTPPPARSATPAPATTAPGTQASVRLPSGKLDTLVAEAGELVAVRAEAERLASELDRVRSLVRGRDRAVGGLTFEEIVDEVGHLCQAGRSMARSISRTTTAVQDAVLDAAMLPFEVACDGLGRVVRDVAAATGKEAALEVVGAEVEVDRRVLATLRDPLTHAVRNAVDHGIEPPDVREQRGKDRRGTVRVAAVHRGGVVDICVEDDGAGVDRAALRDAAVAAGITVTEDDGSTDLMFAPSLSTAETATQYSGRGVGMDIVRRAAESLGGTAVVTSEPLAGTRVIITVPLTLSTMQVLLVSAGGHTLALATSGIDRVIETASADVRDVAGRPTINVDDRRVPLVPLAAATGMDDPSPSGQHDHITAVLVGSGSDHIALEVADVGDVREVLVKPLGPRLHGLPGGLGGTVLVDGTAVLVLHPVTVARRGRALAPTSTSTPERDGRSSAGDGASRVLLVEDTITTRALERSVLESAGYVVLVAGDGEEAWRLLQEQDVDIVVSDVDMPRMDGVALCRAIRGAPRLRDLPVVLVTSLGSEDDRRRGLEAGADAYVVKSGFEQRRFLETIERLL